MTKHLCEVCEGQATMYVVDVREIDPVVDNNRMEWPQYEPDGGKHWRCAEHRRKPKETSLDGTVEGGDERSPEGKAWAAKQE